jgi:hypothetical protein
LFFFNQVISVEVGYNPMKWHSRRSKSGTHLRLRLTIQRVYKSCGSDEWFAASAPGCDKHSPNNYMRSISTQRVFNNVINSGHKLIRISGMSARIFTTQYVNINDEILGLVQESSKKWNKASCVSFVPSIQTQNLYDFQVSDGSYCFGAVKWRNANEIASCQYMDPGSIMVQRLSALAVLGRLAIVGNTVSSLTSTSCSSSVGDTINRACLDALLAFGFQLYITSLILGYFCVTGLGSECNLANEPDQSPCLSTGCQIALYISLGSRSWKATGWAMAVLWNC